MGDFTILIPARRNSKGFPFKNRMLLNYTLNSIPLEFKDKIIVNTDDEYILEECNRLSIKTYTRPSNLGLDETSTKDVILDMVNNNLLSGDVIMLYLTYPERTWDDIILAYIFFIERKAKSLLCKKEIKSTHPYLYMLELENNKGKQLVSHNLYRRQDYPKVFEISHFISIFKTNNVKKLNNNLYNKNTIFYPISNKIDVDSELDLKLI